MKRQLKQWSRSAKYTGGILGLGISLILFRAIPERLLLPLGRFLGGLSFRISSRYRRKARENLHIVYGKTFSSATIDRIAVNVFKNQGMVIAELMRLISSKQDIACLIPAIPVDGKERLDAALALGKGVIALGAHVNNFFLVGSRLAAEGYPFDVVQHYPDNKLLAAKMKEYTIQIGQNPIPKEPRVESVKHSLRSLKKNHILFLITDERQKKGGEAVFFFGKPALTATGPAVLSLKTGAPILPLFMIREKNRRNRLHIGTPVTVDPSGDRDKDIRNLTQACTRVIEECVERHPEQWAWVNRRWEGVSRQPDLDLA
jgi:Kdo2-lipid IVA lauroyltransferase/acyltransferase